jgi:predicted RNA binding protein YcfA (HicA-like mRNA interferase family)
LKTPRNLSGKDLVLALKQLDYTQTRKRGSHIRITTLLNGQHHITIPNHQPLKTGTLTAILNDIANHHKMEKEKLLQNILEKL